MKREKKIELVPPKFSKLTNRLIWTRPLRSVNFSEEEAKTVIFPEEEVGTVNFPEEEVETVNLPEEEMGTVNFPEEKLLFS